MNIYLFLFSWPYFLVYWNWSIWFFLYITFFIHNQDTLYTWRERGVTHFLPFDILSNKSHEWRVNLYIPVWRIKTFSLSSLEKQLCCCAVRKVPSLYLQGHIHTVSSLYKYSCPPLTEILTYSSLIHWLIDSLVHWFVEYISKVFPRSLNPIYILIYYIKRLLGHTVRSAWFLNFL